MSEKKFDANEVAFLELQLEAMRQKELEIEYALPKAMSFVPVKSDVPAGAESFAYFELDRRGEADWIANGANDVPFAEVEGAKQSSPLHRMAIGYRYTFDDIKAAQLAGMPIDQKRRRAARDALNRKIDDVIAFGDSLVGFSGLANHPNVPNEDAAAPGTGADKSWQGPDKTTLEILADMNALINKIPDQTKDLHEANVLLLPSTLYRFVKNKPLSSDGNNSDSILNAFMQQNPGVRVMPWEKLELADALGTGPRAIAFEMDPDNAEFVVADPIAEDPIERKGRSYEVAMTAKVGGLVMYRPLAFAYQDDI